MFLRAIQRGLDLEREDSNLNRNIQVCKIPVLEQHTADVGYSSDKTSPRGTAKKRALRLDPL